MKSIMPTLTPVSRAGGGAYGPAYQQQLLLHGWLGGDYVEAARLASRNRDSKARNKNVARVPAIHAGRCSIEGFFCICFALHVTSISLQSDCGLRGTVERIFNQRNGSGGIEALHTTQLNSGGLG